MTPPPAAKSIFWDAITGMSFEDAAPICDGALNALMCLKQADLRKGRSILIYGASGLMGAAAAVAIDIAMKLLMSFSM